jgi:YbbR domain-containing protein
MTKTLPVDVPLSGSLPSEFTVQQKDVEPSQLEIGGPESHVLAARRLISDPFDLTGVTSDTEKTLSVYASDPELRFLTPPRVTVRVRVQRVP